MTCCQNHSDKLAITPLKYDIDLFGKQTKVNLATGGVDNNQSLEFSSSAMNMVLCFLRLHLFEYGIIACDPPLTIVYNNI